MSIDTRHTNVHLPSSFREFLQALNRYQVEFMLIGGYAVRAYGHVRATGDLDIYINATSENAQRMCQAWFKSLPFYSHSC